METSISRTRVTSKLILSGFRRGRWLDLHGGTGSTKRSITKVIAVNPVAALGKVGGVVGGLMGNRVGKITGTVNPGWNNRGSESALEKACPGGDARWHDTSLHQPRRSRPMDSLKNLFKKRVIVKQSNCVRRKFPTLIQAESENPGLTKIPRAAQDRRKYYVSGLVTPSYAAETQACKTERISCSTAWLHSLRCLFFRNAHDQRHQTTRGESPELQRALVFNIGSVWIEKVIA